MKILKRNGKLETLSFDKIVYRLKKLATDKNLGKLSTIDTDIIAQKVVSSIYDGVSSSELDEEAARIAIAMTENLEFGKLASRIIISNLHKNTTECFSQVMENLYQNVDSNGLPAPVLADEFIENVREFKDTLNSAIDYSRDYLFDYFGFKTLEKSYLMKLNKKIVERPQHLYMRVAIQLHKNDIDNVIKTYNLISEHYLTFASPSLFNAGGRLPQLSSCFHEDTIVATINKGPIKIKDVEIDDLVITHLGNVKKVQQLHKNLLNNRTFYDLNIYKTQNIKVTDNHKLWACTKELKPLWISVNELKIGDYVSIPNGYKGYNKDYIIDLLDYKDLIENKGTKGIEFKVTNTDESIILHSFYERKTKNQHTKNLENHNYFTTQKTIHNKINRFVKIDSNFARFLGIWYGDGFIFTNTENKNKDRQIRGIGITIDIKNKKLIKWCTEYMKNTFGLFNISKSSKTTYNLTCVSVYLGLVFEKLFGKGFDNKKIFKDSWQWDITLINELVCGLLCSDGGMKKDGLLQLSMTNPLFMQNLYYLLRNYGIDVSLGKDRIQKYNGKIYKTMSIPKRKEYITSLMKTYTDGRIKKALKMLDNKNQKVDPQVKKINDKIFLRLKSKIKITENLPEYVYTLGVEDDHSYNIGGIIAINCFLLGTEDSIEGIFKTMSDVAQISKLGGGIGIHINNIRSKGTVIRRTNGHSDGIIPMLKVYNEICKYVNQSSRRKGSFAIYLSPEHPDIFEFLDLRKNQGSEDLRARDLFLAMWLSDLFMKQVESNGDWYLFDPDECPGLDEKYGDEYEDLYWKYVEEKKYKKQVKAQDIWVKILENQIETGTPYILYKDAGNKMSNQKNIGPIKSSNLCVAPETMILTSNGYYKIKELENREVNIWNGQEFTKTKVQKTGENQQLIKVKLSNGSELECTPYHKFYINNKQYIHQKIDAKDLKKGMKLIKSEFPIIKEGLSNFPYPYEHAVNLVPNKILNKTLNNIELKPKFEVPINHNINIKLRWLEGLVDSNGYIRRFGKLTSIQISSVRRQGKDFLENVKYLLQTLGCDPKVKLYKVECKLLITSWDVANLYELGLRPKRLKISNIYPKNNKKRWIQVEDIIITNRRSDTYCFKEEKRGMGIFNGILTGQCTEIFLHSSSTEYAVCFTGDTQILTKQGYRRIDECDNKEVLSYFNNDKELKEKQQFINAKLIDNGIKDIYELKCNSTKSIKATDEHLFAVLNKRNKNKKTNTYIWKKLKDLNKNDKIILPKTQILPDYNIDIIKSVDENYLTIGWIVGDGWQCKTENMTNSVYGVCFRPNEHYARDRVIKKLVEWTNNVEFMKNGYHIKTNNFYTDKNKVFNWASSKQNFIKYIKDEYGLMEKTAHYKCIPDKIKKSQPKYIASFLSGLFSADGSVYIKYTEKRNRFNINLSSSSKILLDDVQQMLKCFGIESRTVFGDVKNRKDKQGKLSIENKDSIINFNKYINFILCKEKQQQLECGLKIFKKRNIFREYTKLKSITYIGKEKVYDLNVPVTHNFIAEGFVVHNCNLMTVAVHKYIDIIDNKPVYNHQKLFDVVKHCILPMNNIIDYNYYPVPETEKSNKLHRPIGIGVQSINCSYIKMRYPFESEEAKQLNKDIFETIYFACLSGSLELAKKDGAYSTFKGSPMSEGKFQFDLHAEFNGIKPYVSGRWDWESLRTEIKKHGIRNSTLTMCAPTASSAQIMGNCESFEPLDSCIFKRTVLSGEYMVVNKYLVEDLTKLKLWNKDLKEKIILNNGSIQKIDEIPDNIKQLYKTVWEISMKNFIDQSSDRAQFIDMSQSLNIFMETPTIKKLNTMHFYGWKKGLKTGSYYIRSRSENAGKFSVNPELEKKSRNKKKIATKEEILACSIDNKENCDLCSS